MGIDVPSGGVQVSPRLPATPHPVVKDVSPSYTVVDWAAAESDMRWLKACPVDPLLVEQPSSSASAQPSLQSTIWHFARCDPITRDLSVLAISESTCLAPSIEIRPATSYHIRRPQKVQPTTIPPGFESYILLPEEFVGHFTSQGPNKLPFDVASTTTTTTLLLTRALILRFCIQLYKRS